MKDALTSPITLGIVVGYVVGKPVAVSAAAFAVTKLSHSRLRPPVGWAGVLGSGTLAGIGFTVSFLIATLAFQGEELNEAKIGVLAAAALAALLTWVVYQVTARLAPPVRAKALLGHSEQLVDLLEPVDPARDHIRGAKQASVTVVEYGDFQCPFCGQAEPSVRELLGVDDDIRYVWRHLPLTDVHPDAQRAAEVSEAAAEQGQFWPMHDLLLTRQDNLKTLELLQYAQDLGLDSDKIHQSLKDGRYQARIAQDVESADVSGVSGTPTLFVNGLRYYGAYDIETLTEAIRTARARALI